MTHGVCIPGLSVAAREFPRVPGMLTLENPEVGAGVRLERDYTLEEVAEMHVATLGATFSMKDELTLCGYSMGGMILSIMATVFRSKLPLKTKFVFLMTSPNLPELVEPNDPASGERVRTVRHGTEEEYAAALRPYFSDEFLVQQPRRFAAYVRYRTYGLNGQTSQSLFRQLLAMQRCRAHEYFTRIENAVCTFIGSSADRIFGRKQNAALASLCPSARHVELSGVGHMIHHERPSVIEDLFIGP
jgi:pimeloyl-ACP methyl ester carboxylesterase